MNPQHQESGESPEEGHLFESAPLPAQTSERHLLVHHYLPLAIRLCLQQVLVQNVMAIV